MTKDTFVSIDTLEDGRICAVIWRWEGKTKVILSVCADHDPEALKRQVADDMRNQPWEKRQ